MFMQKQFKYGFLAGLIALGLAGCSIEAEDGDVGAPGAQGPQGPAGEDGENATQGISMAVIGRVALGGEGGAEIVQYHSGSQTIYATNSIDGSISVISAADLSDSALDDPINQTNLTFTSLALPGEVNGVTLGGLTSIAVKGDWMAVAVPAADKTDNGYVLFYSGLDSNAPAYVTAVEVGALPDMVTFTPNGSKVLVANEGEPSSDYTIDPQGSVSIITIDSAGGPADRAQTLGFEGYNDSKADLTAQGMHFPNPAGRVINGVTIVTTVAQDMEPEYITATDTTAYVTLQENNGLAIVDLDNLTLSVVGLGVKNWADYQLDAQEDGRVGFGQYEGLYGLYMPDTITRYDWKGATFLLTANEGDAREYLFEAEDEAACLEAGGLEFDDGDCLAYTDEIKLKNLEAASGSPLEALQVSGDADDLRVTVAMGDEDGDGEYDAAYAYGARSFTIWDQNGMPVFDSGDDFERITAAVHGAQFNNGDDENEGDSRSENKGPEPEAITIGTIGERTYAFIGLERMGGIFIYDITNPYDVSFVDYVINRDLTEGLSVDDGIGDLAPESLVFVGEQDSATGNALLISGNEISGTVTVWQIQPQ